MPDFSDHSFLAETTNLFSHFSELAAVEYPADPYSACWCQSGKKWKFCHKGRDKQKQKPRTQSQHELFNIYRTGYCQHPEASTHTCSSAHAIRSHTVQRHGGLATIAENGHVYSFKKSFTDLDMVKKNGLITAKKIGVGEASTFPGFCSIHDTNMFKEVEALDAVFDKWTGFLLSFRALTYELFTKMVTLQHSEETRQYSDYGYPFHQQVGIQTLELNVIKGYRIGVEKMVGWKRICDDIFLQKNPHDYHLYGVTFEGPLPFVASGALMPEYDFHGNLLQELWKPETIEQVCFNVTTVGKFNVAVLGWIGRKNGPAEKFVNSFASVPKERKADAALFVAFDYLENTFIKISWWGLLPNDVKTTLDAKVANGADSKPRASNSLMLPSQPILNIGVQNTIDCRNI